MGLIDGYGNTDVNAAVRYLRTLFDKGASAALSDGQLLERYVAQGEESLLEALVLRHGPMVWGVCRRVLGDHHDAEEAFQATFLVLTRRAASVMPREKVGNWLYGVAYQTARKARATRARRRMRESDAPDAPEPVAAARGGQDDLAEVLDHELNRLPDKYRTPVILCELEGKSHGEAAERLGWPIGTVSGRLSRARAILAKRLTRRGLLPAGGSLAVVLALNPESAPAGVSASLLSSTMETARLFADGQAVTVVSARVIALTREVLKAMYLSKIKKTFGIAAAALLALTLTGAGLWQAKTWADGKAAVGDTGRVTVNEVINNDDVVVTQIRIELPPGCKIEVYSDDKGSTRRLTADARDVKQPDGSNSVEITVLADQVEIKQSGTNMIKFMVGYKIGKLSSSSSQMVPMPADAKQLSDVLSVPIKSGEFKVGQPTKLVTLKGVTHSFLVTREK